MSQHLIGNTAIHFTRSFKSCSLVLSVPLYGMSASHSLSLVEMKLFYFLGVYTSSFVFSFGQTICV